METYGVKFITFVFGVVIYLICPVIFRIQNILFGLVITNGRLGKNTLIHVCKTTREQLVVIYDITLFNTIFYQPSGFICSFFKVAAGYLVYLLPITLIGYGFLTAKNDSIICYKMKAPFLLDNSYPPAIDMNKLYALRRDELFNQDRLVRTRNYTIYLKTTF